MLFRSLTANDAARITEATTKLTTVAHSFAEKVYKKQAETQGGPQDKPQDAKGENVMDADYEVVDEEGKEGAKK